MSLEITEEVIARQSPEAQAVIRLLLAERQKLRAELAEVKGELAAAKAELMAVKTTPRNSSLPPSSEHPHAKLAAAKRKKKRGGQPGHPKHERPLIPTEHCQEVVACKPKRDIVKSCGRVD